MNTSRLGIICAVLVLSLLPAAAPIDASPPVTLLSEDWESGTIDLTEWTLFGEPTPSLYPGEGIGGSYAVNNNGDGNYASGIFASTALSITQGVKVEFWQRGGGPLGSLWSGNDVGLIFCGPDVDHVHCGEWVAFVHSSAEDEQVFYTAMTEAGTEQLREDWSPLAGDWHKFVISVEQDGLVSFYVDDQLKFATSASIDFETYDHAWFEIRGRSMFGAYYYVDDILVTGLPPDGSLVYLPLVFRNHVSYPSANVSSHISGTDGRIAVPLTGGGTATFEFTDLLDQPIGNIPVVSIENEAGITIIAMAHEQGFTPLLVSVPTSEFVQSIAESSPDWSIFRGFKLKPWWLNEQVPIELKGEYIRSHLQSLAQVSEDWVKEEVLSLDTCDLVVAPLLVLHFPTSFVGAVVTVGVHEMGAEACRSYFKGKPGYQKYYLFSNRTRSRQFGDYVETLPEIMILDWESTLDNSTGIIFGSVVDKNSGLGLEGVTVSLDDSPDYVFTTLSEGGYRFEGVPPGIHELTASRSGYTSDSRRNVLVSANEMVEVPDLEVELTSWGIWRIQNDTSGILTIDLDSIGTRDLNPGTHDWMLPPGTYDFTAWTTACGGVVNSRVTIYSGFITGTRFYCGAVALNLATKNIFPVD